MRRSRAPARRLLDDPSPLVRAMAVWAVAPAAEGELRRASESAAAREKDEEVLAELDGNRRAQARAASIERKPSQGHEPLHPGASAIRRLVFARSKSSPRGGAFEERCAVPEKAKALRAEGIEACTFDARTRAILNGPPRFHEAEALLVLDPAGWRWERPLARDASRPIAEGGRLRWMTLSFHDRRLWRP